VKNCYVLCFDTAAVEERRNWTVVFNCDHLPYNLLWPLEFVIPTTDLNVLMCTSRWY